METRNIKQSKARILNDITGKESLEVRVKKLEKEVGDLKNELKEIKKGTDNLENLFELIFERAKTIKEKDKAIFILNMLLYIKSQNNIY